jgi:hypothetical protein
MKSISSIPRGDQCVRGTGASSPVVISARGDGAEEHLGLYRFDAEHDELLAVPSLFIRVMKELMLGLVIRAHGRGPRVVSPGPRPRPARPRDSKRARRSSHPARQASFSMHPSAQHRPRSVAHLVTAKVESPAPSQPRPRPAGGRLETTMPSCRCRLIDQTWVVRD